VEWTYEVRRHGIAVARVCGGVCYTRVDIDAFEASNIWIPIVYGHYFVFKMRVVSQW
jgi:hypothetical protein